MNRKHIQILQVSSREFLVSNNLDLSLALLANDNGVAQVVGSAINLDSIVEELLEGGEVEDLVVDGVGGVDDEFVGDFCALWALLRGTLLYHAS